MKRVRFFSDTFWLNRGYKIVITKLINRWYDMNMYTEFGSK